jgi:hypothetical protein
VSIPTNLRIRPHMTQIQHDRPMTQIYSYFLKSSHFFLQVMQNYPISNFLFAASHLILHGIMDACFHNQIQHVLLLLKCTLSYITF